MTDPTPAATVTDQAALTEALAAGPPTDQATLTEADGANGAAVAGPPRVSTVRPATAYDENAAVTIWAAARAATGLSPSDARRTQIRGKLRAPLALCLLAEDEGGEPVGMLLAELGRSEDGRGKVTPGLLHLSMLFVTPGRQRTGVGRALVDALTGRYGWVSAWAAADNAGALGGLQACGFTPTGRTQPVGDERSALQFEHSLTR